MPTLLSIKGTEFWALLPLGTVLAVGFLVLLIELFVRSGKSRFSILPIAGNGMLLATLLTWTFRDHVFCGAFFGSIDLDRFGVAFSMIFTVGAYLTFLLSHRFVTRHRIAEGPYSCLIIFATAGMILMAQAADLLTLFLGLEVMSVSLYILVGLVKADPRSSEASIKYFLVGVFSSALFLYGIALTYGASGSVALRSLGGAMAGEMGVLATLGMGFLLAGFFFKVAAAPFHMWAPDVYEGSPTPVAAFLATGVKAAAFAGLTRTLYLGFPGFFASWTTVIWGVAIATMVIGNLAALCQNNLKRLLAYSSIAHAGILLVALISVDLSVPDPAGAQALLYYLLAYTVATVGAFAMLSWAGEDETTLEYIEDFCGLSESHPVLAFALAVFMLTLAGIPPTAGFTGKYFIFSAAVAKGHVDLVVIGVLASLVSVYYYMKVVVCMYMFPPAPGQPFTYTYSVPTAMVLGLSMAGVVYLGLMPATCWRMAGAAIGALF